MAEVTIYFDTPGETAKTITVPRPTAAFEEFQQSVTFTAELILPALTPIGLGGNSYRIQAFPEYYRDWWRQAPADEIKIISVPDISTQVFAAQNPGSTEIPRKYNLEIKFSVLPKASPTTRYRIGILARGQGEIRSRLPDGTPQVFYGETDQSEFSYIYINLESGTTNAPPGSTVAGAGASGGGSTTASSFSSLSTETYNILNAKEILAQTNSGFVTQAGADPPKIILQCPSQAIFRINNLTLHSTTNIGTFDMLVYHNNIPIAFIDGKTPKPSASNVTDRIIKYNIINKNEPIYLLPGQSISIDPQGTYGGTATIFYVCSYELLRF